MYTNLYRCRANNVHVHVPRKIVVRDPPGALSHFRSISRASKLLTYLYIETLPCFFLYMDFPIFLYRDFVMFLYKDFPMFCEGIYRELWAWR
jgi:hypothetical protein